MNTLKLNAILQQFIDNFDYLSAKDGGDEGYKWVAAYCFEQNWNIEAEDFLAMFNDSMKEMSNLIDNSQVQPLSGIRLLLKQPEEVEFVRNSFKELFSDDNGDIAARQDRVDAFVESVNGRIAKYTPEGSWRYNQSRGNVIYYLNLWRPHENYIYKATEANEWAACIEFGEDFGSGTTFSLAKYYKMCDELLDEIKKNETIVKLSADRVASKGITDFDDQLHILVYDIIYCNHNYLLYDKAAIAKVSTKERLKKHQILQKMNGLEAEINQKQCELEQIEKPKPLPDINGCTVQHKKYGEGKVVSIAVTSITVIFDAGEKKFKYPDAFVQGFLLIEGYDFVEIAKYNKLISEKRRSIEEELGLLRKAHAYWQNEIS